MRRRSSRRRAGGLRTARDLVEDRHRILAARVLVGRDDEPTALAGDPAHHARFPRSRSPADPKTAMSPPPRAAATGARIDSTFSSEAGLCA